MFTRTSPGDSFKLLNVYRDYLVHFYLMNEPLSKTVAFLHSGLSKRHLPSYLRSRGPKGQ